MVASSACLTWAGKSSLSVTSRMKKFDVATATVTGVTSLSASRTAASDVFFYSYTATGNATALRR